MEGAVIENKRVCYCCGSDKTYMVKYKGSVYPDWHLNHDSDHNALCRKCYQSFFVKRTEKHRDYVRRYSRKRYWGNLERARKEAREHQMTYRIKYPEKARKISNEYHYRCKIKALEIVGRGKIECIGCHIKDIRVLSINHINGDGRILRGRRGSGGNETNQRIINGLRSINDLNLLCWNCNHLHWIEILQKNKNKNVSESVTFNV